MPSTPDPISSTHASGQAMVPAENEQHGGEDHDRGRRSPCKRCSDQCGFGRGALRLHAHDTLLSLERSAQRIADHIDDARTPAGRAARAPPGPD